MVALALAAAVPSDHRRAAAEAGRHADTGRVWSTTVTASESPRSWSIMATGAKRTATGSTAPAEAATEPRVSHDCVAAGRAGSPGTAQAP